MKYIRLFEQFEEGHKFDILDLFMISPSEVEELFFKELNKETIDLENIQVFLDSGLVDVHTKGKYGYTPLHRAAMGNHLELAQLLISSGAELEAKDEYGRTPLDWAAWENSLELAQFLISSGADLNAKDNDGRTPLDWARNQKMKELLISHGGVR